MRSRLLLCEHILWGFWMVGYFNGFCPQLWVGLHFRRRVDVGSFFLWVVLLGRLAVGF